MLMNSYRWEAFDAVHLCTWSRPLQQLSNQVDAPIMCLQPLFFEALVPGLKDSAESILEVTHHTLLLLDRNIASHYRIDVSHAGVNIDVFCADP